MRSFLWGLVLLIVPLGWLPGQVTVQFSGSAAVASRLFLGDRDCGDNMRDCLFARQYTAARYLHVVLHDLPGNDDWQIQMATVCSADMPNAAQGVPIESSGYLEIVIDAQGLQGQNACFVFRGRHHYLLTYYAAYFDSDPGPDAGAVFPGYQQSNGIPDLPDLDVSYLHRSPGLAYDGQPNQLKQGQPVTWTAHIRNAGAASAVPFSFRWRMDGRLLQTGSVPDSLPAGGESTVSIALPWDARPHQLSFQIQPNQEEIGYYNDRLTVRTDGLTLGFWVERSAWLYFERNQWHYCRELSCANSTSFADWLERQVSTWNELFANSVYLPLAPTGVADRVRLDQITIVPDGSLPLHGGIATNTPDLRDHTVDLEWGLPAAGVDRAYRLRSDGPFNVDWGLLHELGHARSLADLYRFDIAASDPNSVQLQNVAGQPLYDPANPLSPGNTLRAFYSKQGSLVLFQNAERDLMSCTCTTNYSAYTTLVMNRIRSRRARCGNVNAPCNLGDWFLDLPPRNLIHITDSRGRALAAGTVIRAYADTATSYTGHHFDRNHLSILHTDRYGTVTLGSDPFSSHGDIGLAGHNLLLLEIQASHADTFCFIEPTTFNLAYWNGYRDLAHPAVYRLRLGRQDENDCRLGLPKPLLNEPFGVSPAASSAILSGKVGSRTLSVHLRDDAIPPHNLYARQLEIQTVNGKTLLSDVTDISGTVRLRIPAKASSWRLVDITDNSLIIPVEAAVHLRRAVPQR